MNYSRAIIIIRDLSELDGLRARQARRYLSRVVLDLPGAPAKIRHLEHRINSGLRTCGCGTGAVFVFVGILVLAISRLAARGAATFLGMLSITEALGILILLALVGKMLGIIFAEWQLQAAIRDARACSLIERREQEPPRCVRKMPAD